VTQTRVRREPRDAMGKNATVPDVVQAQTDDFLTAVDSEAPGLVEGLYLLAAYGCGRRQLTDRLLALPSSRLPTLHRHACGGRLGVVDRDDQALELHLVEVDDHGRPVEVHGGEVLAKSATLGTKTDQPRKAGARRANAPQFLPRMRSHADATDRGQRHPDVPMQRSYPFQPAKAQDQLVAFYHSIRHLRSPDWLDRCSP